MTKSKTGGVKRSTTKTRAGGPRQRAGVGANGTRKARAGVKGAAKAKARAGVNGPRSKAAAAAGNGAAGSEGGLQIVMLPAGQIMTNDYNPNEMSKKDREAYAAEVRKLKRLPRPLVVRPQGEGGYVLVDGQHGLEAAREAGMTHVHCEVIDVDDFEARRQSFQRNRHGDMNPLKVGEMFADMMKLRTLTQRALAKEVGVADGTARNYLSYKKAFELRDGYAAKEDARKKIAGLSVKHVQHYLNLPEGERDRWLDDGAKLPLPSKPAPTSSNGQAEGARPEVQAQGSAAQATKKAAPATAEAKSGGEPDKADALYQAWEQADNPARRKFLARLLRRKKDKALIEKVLAGTAGG